MACIKENVVIKPHEDCLNPDNAWSKIKNSIKKVEVKLLPLTTPIYDDKVSLFQLVFFFKYLN